MDGIHPRPCVLLNGGGVCCCPARSSGVVWCGVVCALPCPVCGGEYCGHVAYCLVAVSCGVVWGEYLSEVFVWWGILCPPSPSSWWVGWHGGWWGGMVMKGGCYCTDPPVLCAAPPSVRSVAVLNGGSGMRRDAPSSDWSPLSHCLASPCIVCCLLLRSAVAAGVCRLSSPSSLFLFSCWCSG